MNLEIRLWATPKEGPIETGKEKCPCGLTSSPWTERCAIAKPPVRDGQHEVEFGQLSGAAMRKKQLVRE